MLQAFAGIDLGYFWLWPYDQGGCTCAACAPWGANGHLKTSEAVARLVIKRFPGAKRMLSTWHFDHFVNGEWDVFAQRINATRPRWIDLILADDYGASFPEFIHKNGVPGGYPLVTFAAISMFGMSPWGGFGANPLPAHFQNIWNQCSGLIIGGFPYSEGIYEDLNKVIQFQFGWDPQRPAIETVREYAAYEYGPEASDDVVRAVRLIEEGHGHQVDHTALGTSKRPVVYRLRQTAHAEACLSLLQRAQSQQIHRHANACASRHQGVTRATAPRRVPPRNPPPPLPAGRARGPQEQTQFSYSTCAQGRRDARPGSARWPARSRKAGAIRRRPPTCPRHRGCRQ